jgi:hypothetical protein
MGIVPHGFVSVAFPTRFPLGVSRVTLAVPTDVPLAPTSDETLPRIGVGKGFETGFVDIFLGGGAGPAV